MLKHSLISAEEILILEPSDPLEAANIEAVPHDIDPYIAEDGSLPGVLIFAKAFPGWLNLEAAIAYLQLIDRHHQMIHKLAVVIDNGLLAKLPHFAVHLLHPEVKHFSEDAYEDALSWLQESVNTAK